MSSQKSATNPYSKPFFKRSLPASFIVLVIIAGAVACAETANAGLGSFVSRMFGDQQASAEMTALSKPADSQTSSAIVLQASSAIAGSAMSSDTPPIDDDAVLSADIARMNATSTEPTNTQISIYVVRSGDTVQGIAQMFDVSVSTVLWANDLTSRSKLQTGQTLVILPVTGISYSVKSGDTVQSIAKRYGADVEDILNYNDMTLSTRLKVGTQIIIPDAEIPTLAPAASQRRITVAPNEPLLDGWGWPAYPGYFACPVPGARLSQGLHGHNAVDLAIARGTPIRAAADGTVIISRSNGAWNGGYGNFVVILHPNGTQTLYAHMSKAVVAAGSHVTAFQTIGYVGMTGLTTGPHVHLEIRGAQNPFVDQGLCR